MYALIITLYIIHAFLHFLFKLVRETCSINLKVAPPTGHWEKFYEKQTKHKS